MVQESEKTIDGSCTKTQSTVKRMNNNIKLEGALTIDELFDLQKDDTFKGILGASKVSNALKTPKSVRIKSMEILSKSTEPKTCN